MNVLIVLGGDAPGKALLESCASCADLTIAADRGLEAFAHAGIIPDILLGDMDSVSEDVLARMQSVAEIDRLPCVKDDTDGVHAVDVAMARGAKHITLLGALVIYLIKVFAERNLPVLSDFFRALTDVEAAGNFFCAADWIMRWPI